MKFYFQKRGRIFREQKLLEVARTALVIPLPCETFHLHSEKQQQQQQHHHQDNSL